MSDPSLASILPGRDVKSLYYQARKVVSPPGFILPHKQGDLYILLETSVKFAILTAEVSYKNPKLKYSLNPNHNPNSYDNALF